METFAFAYYRFRPKEHNFVSEWDFLYNKAHNEYLNYAATTGLVGLGSYLLVIGFFIFRSLKQFKIQNTLPFALLSGYVSILITNFFGFSVMPVALYFWLIPAMCFLLYQGCEPSSPLGCETKDEQKLARGQLVFIVFLLFSIFYLLFTLARMWQADTYFARAYQLAHAGYHKDAYQPFHQAISLAPSEPFYRDELSYTDAVLAQTAWEQKEATLAGQLTQEALIQSQIAIKTSPSNVNFWKTRTKVFYGLAEIDGKYNEQALESLLVAQKLAPTDPKIAYNLGLLYGRVDKRDQAIKTLEETVGLKPDYREARFALALFYDEAGRRPEAVIHLEYILDKIASDDASAIEKLRQWGLR